MKLRHINLINNRLLPVLEVLEVASAKLLEFLILLFMVFWIGAAFAFGVVTSISLFANKAHAAIPAEAAQYKRELIRAARYEFGLDAPVALIAAQIHQESQWKRDAVSPVGAQGLAQFMPATARWLPDVVPSLRAAEQGELADTPKEKMPFNPAWALRAVCAYNRWLLFQIKNTHTPADHWAFVLSAYNGGLGWVNRDRKLAAQQGYDPARYWGHVEMVNAGRSAANIRENRQYPSKIFARAPEYAAAGWGAMP